MISFCEVRRFSFSWINNRRPYCRTGVMVAIFDGWPPPKIGVLLDQVVSILITFGIIFYHCFIIPIIYNLEVVKLDVNGNVSYVRRITPVDIT